MIVGSLLHYLSITFVNIINNDREDITNVRVDVKLQLTTYRGCPDSTNNLYNQRITKQDIRILNKL